VLLLAAGSLWVLSAPAGTAGPGPAGFSGECASTRSSALSRDSPLGSYTNTAANVQGQILPASSAAWPGECAIRIEVTPRDVSSVRTDRVEMSGPHTRWYEGQSVWYAMSFELARGSPFPPRGGWMVVHQFFAQDLSHGLSGGSPPVAIEITPTQHILVHVRAGRKAAAAAVASRDGGYLLGRLRPGAWNDLLLHIGWSANDDGFVEVWRGTRARTFSVRPQLAVAGPDLLTVAGDVLPVYAETGIYRSRAPSTQVVFFGGLWARQTREGAQAFFLHHPG
jgi:hypothetical protein